MLIGYTGGQTLNFVSVNDIEKKNTVESKGMTYGKHELDAVRKFSYEAWLLLAKLLNILHLCMGNRKKINTNWILLTGPDFFIIIIFR